MELVGKKFYHHWNQNQAYTLMGTVLECKYEIVWTEGDEQLNQVYYKEQVEENIADGTWILIDA